MRIDFMQGGASKLGKDLSEDDELPTGEWQYTFRGVMAGDYTVTEGNIAGYHAKGNVTSVPISITRADMWSAFDKGQTATYEASFTNAIGWFYGKFRKLCCSLVVIEKLRLPDCDQRIAIAVRQFRHGRPRPIKASPTMPASSSTSAVTPATASQVRPSDAPDSGSTATVSFTLVNEAS